MSNKIPLAIYGGSVKELGSGDTIAYAKLSLTGAILNADLAGSIAYSKLSLTGAILNADLAGSIAYSKLSLTGAILNADLAGSIAYSKLSLTGAILNADLAGSIAYSKLSLTGAILNADLAGSIADAKISSAATWNAKESALTFSTGLTRSTNTITSNLNVGVAGGQTIIGGTATTDTLIYKTTTGAGATGARHIFQVGNNGATEAMTILNNGNLGINVVSPGEKLQVNGAIKTTGAAATSMASAAFIDFQSGGGRFVSYGADVSTRGKISLIQVVSNGTSLVTPFGTDTSGNVSLGQNTTITNGNLTLGTAGNALFITEGSNGRVGQVALVAGTKAITITGLATSSRALVTLVTPSGVSLTVNYQAVCTANTLTLQANIAAGTINTSDVSTLNYFVIN